MDCSHPSLPPEPSVRPRRALCLCPPFSVPSQVPLCPAQGSPSSPAWRPGAVSQWESPGWAASPYPLSPVQLAESSPVQTQGSSGCQAAAPVPWVTLIHGGSVAWCQNASVTNELVAQLL